MEYVLIKEDTSYTLENRVREYLEKGYKPTGGVSCNKYGEYLQALIKE